MPASVEALGWEDLRDAPTSVRAAVLGKGDGESRGSREAGDTGGGETQKELREVGAWSSITKRSRRLG